MSKKSCTLFLLVLCLLPGNRVLNATQIDISGRLKTYLSLYSTSNPDGLFFCHGSGEFGFRRTEAQLLFSGSINSQISFRLRLDAYASSGDLISNSQLPESGILGSPVISEYLEMNLYEGAIKVTDFLVDKLDLTVGKQRINWGTADRVNVVDNLNPLDFANFFTFDPDHAFERRPQTAINLEYYIGNVSRLQVVWILQHQISPLPYGYSFLSQKSFGLAEFQIETSWGNTLDDTNFGLRFTTTVFDLDLGFSYYNGNFPMPVLKDLSVENESSGTFYYPGIQVLGMDVSGEIAGIGFWGEFALDIPDRVTSSLTYWIPDNGNPQAYTETFSLFEKNHFKYALGIDYNFGKGFYANIQFLHGFFDEFDYSEDAERIFLLSKGKFLGELENYLLMQLQYSTTKKDITIALNGMVEMADDQAIILTPNLEFKIADGLLIQTGAFLVVSGDEETTKFGQFKKDNLLYLGFRLDF